MKKKVRGAALSPELDRKLERFRQREGLPRLSDAIREALRRGVK